PRAGTPPPARGLDHFEGPGRVVRELRVRSVLHAVAVAAGVEPELHAEAATRPRVGRHDIHVAVAALDHGLHHEHAASRALELQHFDGTLLAAHVLIEEAGG